MVTHNLPAQLTSFIGRTHELTEITTLLADPACRLLTLVGPGGIGKTRLALEATHPLDFPHGVHFVPLQPVSDAALLPIAIANAIGIQFFGADEPHIQLLNYLRERQTLLILDNFEHLLDGVDFVVELMNAPGVKLLITSRSALNIQAEWRYTVGGLNIPGNGDEILNFDAVKLFAERARRLRHNFSPADHRADVIRICQLTEGMPLALELAAGWLKVMSCAEIASEIQRGLDFLAVDVRDVPERHQSMAAAFAQSWRLLTDDEQQIFQRMSVFRGGFTREAAEKVAGATLQSLAALADKSFLRTDSSGRHDIHELMRQYGGAKLAEAGEVEAICNLHSAYFLSFLAERDADIKGRRQIAAIQEIEADFDNVRAAWYRGADKKNKEAIYKAIYCLMWFCQVRRPLYRKELGQYALDRFTPQPGEQPGLVWACLLYATHSIAIAEIMSEAPAYTKPMIEQSLAVAEVLQHLQLAAYCRLDLGAHLVREENPDALPLLEQAMTDFRAWHDLYHMAATLVWMGFHHHHFNLELAIQLFQECANLSLQIGEYNLAGWAMFGLGVKMFRTGKFDRIDPYLQKALSLFTEIGCNIGILTVRHYLSFMAFFRGRFEEARAMNVAAYQAAVDANYLGETLGTLLCRMFIACFADEDYVRTREIYDAFVSGWGGHITGYAHFVASILASISENYDVAKQHLCNAFDSFFGRMFITLKLVFLPAAALILSGEGKPEGAVEILGLVFSHPASTTSWLEKWGSLNRLREDLYDELGETAYFAAWERGANTDLDTVISDLLEAWQPPQSTLPTKQPLADPLTERECQVLRLIAAGRSNAQIAHQLIVTVGTVKTHIHNIYVKLGVESRTQAIAHAHELHLL